MTNSGHGVRNAKCQLLTRFGIRYVG
jgi:hypothetical protein